MKKNQSRLLNISWDTEGEKVQLDLDKEGIEYLISILINLKEKTGPEHVHLMTPSWGGSELTEEEVSDDCILVNHLKICKWD